MSNKRKQSSPAFKANVALDGVGGEKTVSELASGYSLPPTLINTWKRPRIEGASDLFESTRNPLAAAAQQAQIDERYRQIGPLKVERDG